VNRQPRLKNWTARSCFFAAAIEENVPKFRRLPVLGFFLREYNRYSPDCNFRIMQERCELTDAGWRILTPQNTSQPDDAR
jgi:hypothetical protein